MKPARVKAETERLAKVELRKWARKIPHNGKLINILLQIPDRPFRQDFYLKIRPYLKFEPLPLEALYRLENIDGQTGEGSRGQGNESNPELIEETR